MAIIPNVSQAVSAIKAGMLVTHDIAANTVWATDIQGCEVSHGIALSDCTINEQCTWGEKGEMSGFNADGMPDVYMKTADTRSQLWADFERVINSQEPGTYAWYANLKESQIVFATMLDLHKRMLAMEKRLDESSGDGK